MVGIRVLDLSRFLAGSWASQMLGQHADDVLSRLLDLDAAAIARLRNDGIQV